MDENNYYLEIKLSISEIKKEIWDEFNKKNNNPFYEWYWIKNLEKSNTVTRETGWQPLYFLAYRKAKKELCAIAPLFLKNHSYGEFIFDQSFARLAQDLNLNYYPKLIGMSPYSPIEGYQFLYEENLNRDKITSFLIDNIENFAKRNNILSCNFLYVDDNWSNYLEKLGYHDWVNIRSEWISQSEKSFDDYLLRFNSNQRRNIKRERKSITNKNIHIKTLTGININEEILKDMHFFYEQHCLKWGIWGSKYLTSDFFKNSIENKENLLIFSAYENNSNEPIAMSMCVKNNKNLWGRYWGCNSEIDNLHFELCYYKPIEWAIANNIERFDPGAGGKQKRRRGFYAKSTKSFHKWFDNGMENIICDWLKKTNKMTSDEIEIENNSIPFIK